MTEALHRINLELRKLTERWAENTRRIEAQALENHALRDEVKRLTALVAQGACTKRAPLPPARAGRIGDDR